MPEKMDIMMAPFLMYSIYWSVPVATTGSDTQISSAWSLLDVLKAPTQSWKHVVARNPPHEK